MPRLAGQWSHLERIGGGAGASGAGRIGTRGPGETQIETDRRLVRSRITRLRREIEEVRQQRALHRRRRARQGMKVVALVGYTNAGKSTLLRALSGAHVFTEDLLFATLDPLTRRVRLPSGNDVLITDTVGFIQKLPTQLVASFRATLEELSDADVLVHLVDITHENAEEQYTTVEKTLDELGLGEKPRVVAFNKVDMVAGDGSQPHALTDLQRALREEHPESVLISAAKGWNLDSLLRAVETELVRTEERQTTPA
jgi:GTP-binding protein HflX